MAWQKKKKKKCDTNTLTKVKKQHSSYEILQVANKLEKIIKM